MYMYKKSSRKVKLPLISGIEPNNFQIEVLWKKKKDEVLQ